MKLVDQYRFGCVNTESPVPPWLSTAVENLQSAPKGLDRYPGLLDELRKVCELTLEQANLAKQRLGIDGPVPARVFSLTQTLVNQDPANEAEYWLALHHLRVHQNALDEYQEALPGYANWLELHAQRVELGWPESWAARFCTYWQDLGGDAVSARAWARAGWSAVEALLAIVPGRHGHMSINERVTCIHPPTYEPPVEDDSLLLLSPAPLRSNGGER